MPRYLVWRLRSIILVAVFALMAATPDSALSDIIVDAGRGPLTVRVPSGYAGQPTPLVVLLHGYGSSGSGVDAYFGFQPLVESLGFFYVAPDGTSDNFGNRFWNATDACCDFAGSNVDDVGYLTDLVEAIEVELNVDPGRIYFTGHSNGGFMSHRMACERPDRIAAIASLAGATFAVPADCTPPSAVHVLQIHGTLDGVVLYGGGAIFGTPYPGAVVTTESWAARAGCSLIPDTTEPPLDLDATIPGAETSIARYQADCAPGGTAELWTIVGGGHSPFFSTQFAPSVIGFLYAHPKPAVVSTPSPVALPLAGLAARPNPFRSRTEFGFELGRAAVVSLTVFDVHGRRIRSLLAAETRSAGAHRAGWDGTSDDGARVGSGVYFVRIDVGGTSRLRKIVLGR